MMTLETIASDITQMAGMKAETMELIRHVTIDNLSDPDFEGLVAFFKNNDRREYEPIYDIVEIHARGPYNGNRSDVVQFYESSYAYYEDGSVEHEEDYDTGEISADECLASVSGADVCYIIYNK